MADDGTVLVVSNRQAGAGFTMSASGLPQLGPVSVSVSLSAKGASGLAKTSSFTVGAVSGDVKVPVAEGFSRLEFGNAPRAAIPQGSADHRLLSLFISDVRWPNG
jgi:hypothetical protein